MSKVNAWILRNFRVYAAPEREGEKETGIRFKAGTQIECTAEQLEVGRAAGLLSDQPPEQAAAAPGATESATGEE